MRLHLEVVEALCQLAPYAASWDEAVSSLSVAGPVDQDTLRILADLLDSFSSAGLVRPNLRLGDDAYDRSGLFALAADDPIDWPKEWKLSFDKSRLLDQIPEGAEAYVFLGLAAFLEWGQRLSPHDLGGLKLGSSHTYVIVKGIERSFGGPRLSVLPLSAEPTAEPADSAFEFPAQTDVLKLIHVISDRPLLMDPATVALTWGDRDQEAAAPLRRLSAMVVSLCMVQDVYLRDNAVRVVLRGTRRVELALDDGRAHSVSAVNLDEMYAAVSWIFSEREETRHKLLTDRLSIDVRDDATLIVALTLFLRDALKQAKERYGFVILDRKDAYYKELRDLMKDVRAQADLYAAKVRDLVSALSRDTLAVLFMIGVSLIGKTNTNAIQGLVSTAEVQVFFKVLAIYFILSITLQGLSHWRDLALSKKEGSDWHKLTREYVPESTFKQHFEAPRNKRQTFFRIALVICVILYGTLAYLSWNIATVFNVLSGVGFPAGFVSVAT